MSKKFSHLYIHVFSEDLHCRLCGLGFFCSCGLSEFECTAITTLKRLGDTSVYSNALLMAQVKTRRCFFSVVLSA